jgi:hypothetical protein
VNETAQPDCLTCLYWQSRVSEESARGEAGVPGSQHSEQIARDALAAHVAGGTHTGAENAVHSDRPFAGAGAYMVPRPVSAQRRGHP